MTAVPGPQQPDEVPWPDCGVCGGTGVVNGDETCLCVRPARMHNDRVAAVQRLTELRPTAPSAQPDETVTVAGAAAHGPWCNGYLRGSCDCATRTPAQPDEEQVNAVAEALRDEMYDLLPPGAYAWHRFARIALAAAQPVRGIGGGTTVSASSPRVYVLIDPVQDYEESMRLLSVNGSLEAAQAAARRARSTVHPRFSFENLVTPERDLNIELRSGDLILRRWVQPGKGYGQTKVGSWKVEAKPTEAEPERAL